MFLKRYFSRKLFSIHEIISMLKRNRELIIAMAHREITDRYTGQMLGKLWAIGHPLFLICIYITVFVFVFQMKTGAGRDSDYTLYILTGIIPWLTCQDAMLRGSTVIISHSSLVKQVAFPIEVLPVKTVIACLPNQVISTGLLAVYCLMTQGMPPIIWLFWPLLFSLQTVALVGLAYILAVVGTFFRDLKDVLIVLCTGGLYCIPIFYRVEQLPVWARPLVNFNPFSQLIYCYQDIFIHNAIMHIGSWVGVMICAYGLLMIGYRLFHHTRMLFGNVL